ncbi:MAG TPA: oligosaccharide flippase family protein [Thermoleophilaceae bacterium]|nr:oligosaccharide flippase family protein [Thermoleophilaceae bacterium]
MGETTTPPQRLGFPETELRGRTARGAVLNGVFMGGTQLLALAQGLIATAILGPAGIGLYGVVSITAMSVVELKRIGVDEGFVQQTEADQEAEFQKAFTVELMLAGIAAAVIALLAPIVAWAYGDWRLFALTLAVAYLPVAFALQAPGWVFFRRMDFLRVRTLQAIVPVVSFVVAVPLLVADVGVWSLVIGPFVASVVAVVVAIRMSPYPLAIRFDREAVGRYARFSWPIFVSSAALLAVQQGQLLAFDIEGGLEAVGFITLALLLTRYADRADQVVTTTIYPAICAIRDRVPTLEDLFVKSGRLTLMWVGTFCAGLVLFAPDLVEFVVGDEWEPAVILIQGLAVAAALQQIGYSWFAFYRARGDSRPQAVESAVMVAAFAVLAVPALFVWGAEEFAWARVVAVLPVLLVRGVYVRRLLPGVSLPLLALRAAAPVLLGVAAALALRLSWDGAREGWQAGAEIAVWVAATAAATYALERPLLRELRASLRRGQPFVPREAS